MRALGVTVNVCKGLRRPLSQEFRAITLSCTELEVSLDYKAISKTRGAGFAKEVAQ